MDPVQAKFYESYNHGCIDPSCATGRRLLGDISGWCSFEPWIRFILDMVDAGIEVHVRWVPRGSKYDVKVYKDAKGVDQPCQVLR